jgi:hypothetical protein
VEVGWVELDVDGAEVRLEDVDGGIDSDVLVVDDARLGLCETVLVDTVELESD